MESREAGNQGLLSQPASIPIVTTGGEIEGGSAHKQQQYTELEQLDDMLAGLLRDK